jgi:hypothetical protein
MIKKILFNLLGLSNCKNCYKVFRGGKLYHVTVNHWQSYIDICGIYKTVNHSSVQYCSKKCMVGDLKVVKPLEHYNCKSALYIITTAFYKSVTKNNSLPRRAS